MSNKLDLPDLTNLTNLTDDMLDMIGNFPYEAQTDAQAQAQTQTYVPRESTHPDFYFNFKEENETLNYIEFEKLDTFMNTIEWEGFCRPKRTFKQITFKSKVFRKKPIIPTNFWEYSNKIMSPFQYMLIPKFNTKNSISPLIEKSILPLPPALPSPLAKIDECSEDDAKEYAEENQSAAEDDSDPMKEMEIRLMCDENIDEIPQLKLPVRIKRKYIKKEKGSKVLDKKKYKKRKKNTDDSYDSYDSDYSK